MSVGDRAFRAVRPGARRVGVAVALAVAVLTDVAAAQTLDPATVTVSDFGPVVLEGTATSATATMSAFSVADPNGNGWHVMVQATQFSEVDGAGQYVSGGKTLPIGSLSMPAPAVSPAGGVTVAAGPYLVDGANVQVMSVAAGNPGTFSVTQGGPLTLSIPSSAYARSYRSQVTIALHSGP